MRQIEVLANTEYQDLYRITDGVLLVVNKFEELHPEHTSRIYETGKSKRYSKGTQECLSILKEDRKHWSGVLIPKGTVTYQGIPVIATKEKSKWRYEVKTTGSSLGGDAEVITEMLCSIKRIINEYTEMEL